MKLTNSFGFDIVKAMRMRSHDPLMFSKTAENSDLNSRCGCCYFDHRTSSAQDSRGEGGIDG